MGRIEVDGSRHPITLSNVCSYVNPFRSISDCAVEGVVDGGECLGGGDLAVEHALRQPGDDHQEDERFTLGVDAGTELCAVELLLETRAASRSARQSLRSASDAGSTSDAVNNATVHQHRIAALVVDGDERPHDRRGGRSRGLLGELRESSLRIRRTERSATWRCVSSSSWSFVPK